MVGKNDELGSGMGEYLAQNHANSEFIAREGGHTSSIYVNEDITRLVSKTIRFQRSR